MEQMSTKERILKSAAEVFAEKGLKARIEDIAERAGVAKGTIYLYFPSKEELIFSTIEHLINVEREQLSLALSSSDFISTFKEAILPKFVRMHTYFKIISSAVHLASTSEAHRSRLRELEKDEREMVRELLEKNGVKVSKGRTEGFLILLRGLFLSSVLVAGEVNQRGIEEAVDILLEHIEKGGSENEE
jgi:AcrR family transcriptional regulator